VNELITTLEQLETELTSAAELTVHAYAARFATSAELRDASASGTVATTAASKNDGLNLTMSTDSAEGEWSMMKESLTRQRHLICRQETIGY